MPESPPPEGRGAAGPRPRGGSVRFLATAATAILLLAPVGGCSPSAGPDGDAYRREILEWRKARETSLRSETGWLTLVGLHWLNEGPNRFGTDPGAEILLPDGSAAAAAGSFVLHDGKIRVTAPPGTGLTLDGEPVTDRILRSDGDEGGPDVLKLGDLLLYVIKRGDRFAIRVKDPNSRTRAEFEGMEYYPVNPEYRFRTRLIPYDPPVEVPVPNVLGTPEIQLAIGRVEFPLGGRTVSLTPVVDEPGDRTLFFIFSDATSGHGTYGAGRFLYADLEDDGSVTVDFNKAYTPPCAFTPYATCPLPPKENRLAAAIEAGEKFSGH